MTASTIIPARPGRNRGPKSKGYRKGDRHYFLITHSVDLPQGTFINQCRVPDGSRLSGVPLSSVLFSRGSAKKALRRARRTHPGAKVREGWYVKDYARLVDVRKPSIVPPAGAPAGWWRGLSDGDATAPTPQISVPWGEAKVGAA